MLRRRLALTLVFAIIAFGAQSASAGGGSNGPYIEKGYYNGDTYQFLIPSSSSANPNQLFVGCLNLGPDMTDQATGPVNTFYAIFLPGADQEVCPDGSLRHDHVLTAVPGVPGYSSLWRVIGVMPTSEFDPAITVMPLTSVEDVEAAVAAGQVVLSDTGIIFRAPVIGPTSQ